MDESPDHEPTLIERGMDVHLNHPITTQRGIRNSRPDRWEFQEPHPLFRGGVARERSNQVEELTPRSPRTSSGSGALRTATPPRVHRMQATPDTCVWHRRGWLEHCQYRLKLTPRTLIDLVKKTLQEHPHSCKASGARPAGPLAWPHGIASATRGKNVPSASVYVCGVLTDKPTNARGLLSGKATKVP
jgi:hypothetical protein